MKVALLRIGSHFSEVIIFITQEVWFHVACRSKTRAVVFGRFVPLGTLVMLHVKNLPYYYFNVHYYESQQPTSYSINLESCCWEFQFYDDNGKSRAIAVWIYSFNLVLSTLCPNLLFRPNILAYGTSTRNCSTDGWSWTNLWKSSWRSMPWRSMLIPPCSILGSCST